MKPEEILTIEELRATIFKNRDGHTTLIGILDYFKRNQEHYTVNDIFEVTTMVIGTLELYHKKDPVKKTKE